MSKQTPDGWTEHIDPATGDVVRKKPFKSRESWRDELGEIDPDGLVAKGLISLDPVALRASQAADPPMEDTICSDVPAWLKELNERRAKGHVLMVSDDPQSMTMGFVDVEDNRYFGLHLRTLKTWEPESDEDKALKIKIGTMQGRAAMIEESVLRHEADEVLEDAMMGEVDTSQVEDLLAWTPEKVRAACGLLPPEEYLAQRAAWMATLSPEEQARWNGPEKHRRTGRTTELLVKAVVAALNGRPVKVASPLKIATKELERQASQMAAMCGRPHAFSVQMVRDERGFKPPKLIPNFEEEVTGPWAEAGRLARQNKKDPSLHDERARLETQGEAPREDVLVLMDEI